MLVLSSRQVLACAIGTALAVPAHAQSVQGHERHWLRGSWTTVGQVATPNQAGSYPATMAFSHGVIYLYGYAEHRLHAFTPKGQELWSVGHAGFDAGAFDNVTDIKVDAHGHVWLTDPRAERIDVLNARGELVKTIDGLPEIWGIAPRSDGSFWGWIPGKEPPALYDSTGRPLQRISLSPMLLRADHDLRDYWVSGISDDGMVLTYRWTDAFAVVGPIGGATHEHQGIEPKPWPNVITKHLTINGQDVMTRHVDPKDVGALSASVDGNLLYVLFANGPAGSPNRFRTLDVYRLPDGRYMGSYLLPAVTREVRVDNGLIAGRLDSGVEVWKWTPARAAATSR